MQSKASLPILPLTSVRFFAALYVVIWHQMLWSNHVQTATWTERFVRNGYVAVGFFFVLSGYILAHVYFDSGVRLNKRKFWLSRFARVYPLLFVSLVLEAPNFFLTRWHHDGLKTAITRTSASFLSECVLLQPLNAHFRNINAPSWSLGAEAFFYLLFPFAGLWVWRQSRCRAASVLLILWLCAMSTPVVVTMLHPELFVEIASSNLQFSVELWPVFRIFEFLAGIALCALQRQLVSRFSVEERTRLSYAGLIAAAILYGVVIQFSQRIPFLVMSDGFLIPIYALVVISLVNAEGLLKHVFSHKYLVLLGEASYAVYLLHRPVWLYFSRLNPIDGISVWFLYFAVVICMAIASFYLLERPVRSRILALAGTRSSVALKLEELAAQEIEGRQGPQSAQCEPELAAR